MEKPGKKKGIMTWKGIMPGIEPVSWLSMKVTARCGHQPISPGGLPLGSDSRQYSVFLTASCRMPFMGKSKAHEACLHASSQLHSCCLATSWLYSRFFPSHLESPPPPITLALSKCFRDRELGWL
eukprot:jgi/Botrbrau1/17704/Bobra.0166s0128.1